MAREMKEDLGGEHRGLPARRGGVKLESPKMPDTRLDSVEEATKRRGEGGKLNKKKAPNVHVLLGAETCRSASWGEKRREKQEKIANPFTGKNRVRTAQSRQGGVQKENKRKRGESSLSVMSHLKGEKGHGMLEKKSSTHTEAERKNRSRKGNQCCGADRGGRSGEKALTAG